MSASFYQKESGTKPGTIQSDYIEIFYNPQRRRSKLGYITPIEHELRVDKTSIPAGSSDRNG